MKTTEENKEEVAARLANAKETSMDVAVAAVLYEPDDIFTLNEEQRAALRVFLSRKDVFDLLPSGLVNHCGALYDG